MTHAVGVESTIEAQRSCGFIKHKQGIEVAFDASDLQNLAFDQTLAKFGLSSEKVRTACWRER